MKALHMTEAISLSRWGMENNKGGPFGAVVVKDNVIIGRGWNTVTSHCDPTAHAEVNAIRDACRHLGTYSLEGCEIYTSCEPCPMCLSAIYWSRLDKIYYACQKQDAAQIGFIDDELYRELSLPKHLRRIPTEQMMRKDALEVVMQWADKKDKQLY